MVEPMVLVLIAVVAKLWHDVTALRRRIDSLDQPTPAVMAEPEEQPAPLPVAIPAPVVREMSQPPEPEPELEPRRRAALNLERFLTWLNRGGFPQASFCDSASVLELEASMDGTSIIGGSSG